jgi:hypothetical protein
VQKQRFNVYTMMLIISFFALVTACVLLFLELSSYNEGKWPYWDTSSARTAQLPDAPHGDWVCLLGPPNRLA